MNNSKIINIALLLTISVSNNLSAILTKDLNLTRPQKRTRRRNAQPTQKRQQQRPTASTTHTNAQSKQARQRATAAAQSRIANHKVHNAATKRPTQRNSTSNQRVNPRTNVKKPIQPRRPVSTKLQTNDPFIQDLINNNLVMGYEALQNGSHIVQIKSANQGNRNISGPFGGATCPAMALRSAQLMINFFLTNNIEYLRNIENIVNAVALLTEMKANQIPFSNLHGGTVETILDGNLLELLAKYKAQSEIIETINDGNSTIIESLEMLTQEYCNIDTNFRNQIRLLKANLENAEDGFYWALPFRIGTIRTMNTKSGGHWISIAVTKRNGTLYWFVADSITGRHLATAKQVAQRILQA